MVKCENCGAEKDGKGPILCPECGYVMFDKKPPKKVVFSYKEKIDDGDS